MIKKILIIAGIVFAVIFIIFSIYIFTIYLEFLNNKSHIFSKIEDFSKSLGKHKETEITLGLDETTDIAKPATVILDRNKNIIAKYITDKHKLIPLKEIPFFISKGFILIEDKDFYNHSGINLFRLGSAFLRNIITLGHSGGGSTISQQLAKILFTKQERNTKRKVYEFFCTVELEKRFTKSEILQIYLNSIYLGHGVYGIENAANFYFGKEASRLNIAEAALIVGMNRSPERYSPIKNRDNAKKIQKVVLNQFVKNNFLTDKEEEYEINRFWKKFDDLGAFGNQSFWKTEINWSGYITEYIRQILEKELSYERITSGGITVETTIDLEKQTLAEKIVKNRLKSIRTDVEEFAKKLKYKNYTKEVVNRIEGTLVSIDYRTGDILSIVGGSGYSFANQLNRALYSKRSIGSSVKPFIYAMALNDGKIGDKDINPFTKFKDDVFTYNIDGKKYSPRNYHYNHKYGNMVTLYDALKTSLNTVAVEIFDKMDKKEVADFIRNAAFLYGDSTKRVPEYLSLALGTCELSTLELATAYSVFPREGKTLYPIIIKKIYDYKGNVYYDWERENNPFFNDLYPKEFRIPQQLIKPETSFELVQMMRGVFEKGGTAYWSAYQTGFNGIGYGKSGTSQEFKDGWFAGFNDKEVTVAWVGSDINDSILMASESNATLIWCDYMKEFSFGFTESIKIPENMKLVQICTETGLVATKNCPVKKDFYFYKDTILPEKCYIHQKNDLDLEE
ncbi:MAG: hypothetical protein A2Y34_08180 [Spirochaetes bacterium GWC1_27_15]|nr:MAG: hypothetical protein A2Z98_04165 [Spirochaetes bacterium GWB1_27_13]OHD20018.1 MAG: hypothetical protein A2Y34_08180 [Spirochaetes bacterium GWC1_27_15]